MDISGKPIQNTVISKLRKPGDAVAKHSTPGMDLYKTKFI